MKFCIRSNILFSLAVCQSGSQSVCLSACQLSIKRIFSNNYCSIQPCISESKITQWLIALIGFPPFTHQSFHSRVCPSRPSIAVRPSVTGSQKFVKMKLCSINSEFSETPRYHIFKISIFK